MPNLLLDFLPALHGNSCQMQAPAGCLGDDEDDQGNFAVDGMGGAIEDDWGEGIGACADLGGGSGGWENNSENPEKPADDSASKAQKDPNKVINIEQGKWLVHCAPAAREAARCCPDEL